MPPAFVTRGQGGLRVDDGVTRATRAAQSRPGETIPAEVTETLPDCDVTVMPRVGEMLP